MNRIFDFAHRTGIALQACREWFVTAAGGSARLQIIALLAGAFALNTSDLAALSAVAGPLKEAYHLSNGLVGLLIATTSFSGALFTLPAGILADRVNRKYLLIAAIALWGGATLATGLAPDFVFLLVARIAVGSLTAAASPIVASLTGDFFPPVERAKIYGMILSGELVGTGVGYVCAGEISEVLSWRWPFYLLTIPSIALCWAIWRWLPEPERGGQNKIHADQADARHGDDETRQRQASDKPELSENLLRGSGYTPRPELVLHEDPGRKSFWWAIGYLLKVPTYRNLIIASALSYYFFGGVRGFGLIFLTQQYRLPRAVVSALALFIGLGAVVGVLIGAGASGWLLRRRRPDARIIVPGVSLFAAALFLAPAILTRSVYLGIALFSAGAAAIGAANAPLDAARLDIVHPHLWGRAEAGRMTLRGLLEGGAPAIFGFASQWFGGGRMGLEYAFLLMLIPLVIASCLAVFVRHDYLRDVATAMASVRETRSSS